MPLTLSTLTADADYLRDQEAVFLSGKADSVLLSEYAVSAKADLTDALQIALSLDPDDADHLATLNSYIDQHAGYMTRMISKLQLLYRFRNESVGPGAEMNLEKLDRLERWWKETQRNLPGLATVRGATATASIAIRK